MPSPPHAHPRLDAVLILEVAPVAKPRQTRADVWKKRDCVMRYRAFADKLRLLCPKPPESPLAICFWMPVSATMRKSRGCPKEGDPHRQKPDLDNLVKALLDALWEDDSGIWGIRAEKRWCHTSGHIELFTAQYF